MLSVVTVRKITSLGYMSSTLEFCNLWWTGNRRQFLLRSVCVIQRTVSGVLNKCIFPVTIVASLFYNKELSLIFQTKIRILNLFVDIRLQSRSLTMFHIPALLEYLISCKETNKCTCINCLYCCTVHLVDSLIITQPTNALIVCHLFLNHFLKHFHCSYMFR